MITDIKYERLDTLLFNIDILNESTIKKREVRYLSNVPKKLSNIQVKKFLNIISNCNSKYGNWGFKDPRTSLTYDLIKPYLPEHKLICAFRQPQEVEIHYASRNPINKIRFIKMWLIYNLSIIKAAISVEPEDVIFINYNKFMNDAGEF